MLCGNLKVCYSSCFPTLSLSPHSLQAAPMQVTHGRPEMFPETDSRSPASYCTALVTFPTNPEQNPQQSRHVLSSHCSLAGYCTTWARKGLVQLTLASPTNDPAFVGCIPHARSPTNDPAFVGCIPHARSPTNDPAFVGCIPHARSELLNSTP
jgi:hypothetical protein